MTTIRTPAYRHHATSLARCAILADRRHDCAERDRVLRALVNHLIYWPEAAMTCAEFRGDSIPPCALRLPVGRVMGRALRASMRAARAWAGEG